MPFSRLSILFAFFAFSIAGAVCEEEDDFEIFANGESLSVDCDETVYYDIIYGETLTLSVSPATGTYYWISSNTKIKTGYSYSPEFSVSENPSSDITETYKVRNKDGLTKTIEITISGRPTYTVSFDTDEDDDMTDIDPQDVMKDSLAKKPIETDSLKKEGYYFAGWDFNFSTPIVEDTTIKAIWKIRAYLVDFDTDGGTPSIRSQVVVENELAKEPKETLTRKGYNFKGWDFDFSIPIKKDTTIKALWEIAPSFVGDTIVFEVPGFNIDTVFSNKQRHYFVFSPSRCKVKDSIEIQITTKEPMILKRDSLLESDRSTDEKYMHYKILYPFKHKPGLDTLTYEWFSIIDGSHLKSDTILIETPIPFDTIIGQKWNNVLFVNNNPKTNGGYKFTDFEWFKNNKEVGNLQFYSAMPSSTNTLNPNDIYKVVMQTTEGNRISTCESEVKINPVQPPKSTSTLKKQVLGINEKPLKPGSKVYNLKGKLTKETPAGVYIVKEK